jgi:hypothetical protein
MHFQPHEIERLILTSDPDGVWSIFKKMGLEPECNYIETKYFKK